MKVLIVCVCLCPFLPVLRAQDSATVVKFNLECTIAADYDIWDDDYTAIFTYENEAGRRIIIRTVDTIFSFAQPVMARKFGVPLSKKFVNKESRQSMFGKITGFPNEKVKDVAATGKYKKLIEVLVTVLPGPATVKEKGAVTERKYQIDMIVEVKVYDKDGEPVEKYKQRTRMDEVRQTLEVRGVRDVNDLSGNELFNLFALALTNALANRK